MDKKLVKQTVLPVINIDFIIMAVLGIAALFFDAPYRYFGFVIIGLAVIVRIFHKLVSEKKSAERFASIQSELEQEVEDMTRAFSQNAPLLICLINKDGKLLWGNDKFEAQFESQELFDKIITSQFVDKFFNQPESVEEISVEDKIFSVSAAPVKRHDASMARMLFWQNVTARETIKELYRASRACMAIIDIDNYDELIENTPIEEQSTLAASIDKCIRAWAGEMGASVAKIKANRYSMTFENRYMNKMRSEKFPILDRLHEVQTKTDFPTTASIGIGIGEAELSDLQDSAEEALDLAQARGGDQAVIRLKGGDTEYFGGNLPTIEKRDKVKSRVIAHQFMNAIEASDKIFIAGHKKPDLDSFGAALGMQELCHSAGKRAAIILDAPSEGIEAAYRNVTASGEYEIISHEQALEEITPKTLFIIVDHHIAALSECPEIIDKAKRIAIIDHHRKSANAIESALLTRMEVSASSASELVTEMFQYAGRKQIKKIVAEVLLSGISLDTKSFTTNTGVRTFDAASYLKSFGADSKVIKEYFKMSIEVYQKKATIITSAEVLSNGIAVAYTKDTDPSMQLICAQAADELLDMKGVEAAFVTGRAPEYTVVSARSSGKINVQVVMESLGGGGHQNIAAAQIPEGPEEAIAKIVEYMRKEEML